VISQTCVMKVAMLAPIACSEQLAEVGQRAEDRVDVLLDAADLAKARHQADHPRAR
jgi:hypothetical protein